MSARFTGPAVSREQPWPGLMPFTEEARAFFASLGESSLGGSGAMIVKALAGGGGRGTRAVTAAGELEDAWRRCQSEAQAAFVIAAMTTAPNRPNSRKRISSQGMRCMVATARSFGSSARGSKTCSAAADEIATVPSMNPSGAATNAASVAPTAKEPLLRYINSQARSP